MTRDEAVQPSARKRPRLAAYPAWRWVARHLPALQYRAQTKEARMLTITSRKQESHGEVWLTEGDRRDWDWIVMALPYLVRRDECPDAMGPPPDGHLQQDSDLDLMTMPYYICKVPSVLFFPYVTYFTSVWFGPTPTFVIPNVPVNRLEGRFWLDNLASFPLYLISGDVTADHRALSVQFHVTAHRGH